MNLLSVFLMMGQQGQQGSGSMVSTIVMMVLIVVVFWLFFIRPQSKKNKELQKFREGLKRGDKVITAGGIHGKILEVLDTTVIIETEGLGKLKVEKSSIASSVAGNGE
ncbi:MAG TPA: preprotein translocase subunit YajC [Bacteroidales bacterium]|nr:preprotein translocase subunit YajC [Bacteroidales bacterium]HNZ42481.1 preprotein translocase subunit YajC [Bacteroidales bacterium]HOH83843.1 preprotein translocase subunit YajC [Bacteroidales bacterium]HPB25609.1 preprotein translocase subunit YajC [Bacteroidales bacterium]HPI29801.1 preprotein translocase subunit YajC [Bacteroidales bacterium]